MKVPAEKQLDGEQFLLRAWRNIAVNLPDDVDADMMAEHAAFVVPGAEAPANKSYFLQSLTKKHKLLATNRTSSTSSIL